MWFCERLTWNPSESIVDDVFKQLNLLHQAASSYSWHDIRYIALHCITYIHVSRYLEYPTNWNMRRPGAAHSVAWEHHKREIQLGYR
ncbi:hypothetical protein CSKR_104857 [Clonorchis sinensis]|uniref:Uncharacterized protein n=1 Tax=Clonorchis sinensis TaxID=79923 RepID=A0A3R7CFW6_CLOSI|nr:hypothetical protein CSKR_104857 [Clonorchis sinensis]